MISFICVIVFLNNALLSVIFSCHWYGCWTGWVISWWRQSYRRQSRVTVERSSRRRETSVTWAMRWDLTSTWLTGQTGSGGARQQPCTHLHLFNVVRSHEPTSAMVHWTTQRHCPVTLHFPLSRYSPSSYQEIVLAADWLRTKSEVLQLCTR